MTVDPAFDVAVAKIWRNQIGENRNEVASGHGSTIVGRFTLYPEWVQRFSREPRIRRS
jgi:hypothetical protein